MEKDLVSIIIPCYNASRYLKDVFLSIQNQTYQNIEVIFVDDGSTDETGKMLDEFANSYPKAKVIHKINEGLSSARNSGIKIAKGKYVTFMDADDIISPYTIKRLCELIKQNHADIVISRFKRISNNYAYRANFKEPSRRKTIFDGSDEIFLKFLSDVNGRSVWGKMYRHEIIKMMPNYPNIFNNQCFYGEDILLLVELLQFCKKAVWTKDRLYYWRKVKTSMMHSTFKEKELSVFKCESVLKNLDSNIYQKSTRYVPSLICFVAMDLISKLSHSDYSNPKVINEIYHRYRDNLKYLPRLSYLPFAYRFGTLFTLPIMYMMVRKKL